jgi:hypothetical protein
VSKNVDDTTEHTSGTTNRKNNREIIRKRGSQVPVCIRISHQRHNARQFDRQAPMFWQYLILSSLLFYPEDRGSIFFQNAGTCLPNTMHDILKPDFVTHGCESRQSHTPVYMTTCSLLNLHNLQ